jgi:hypothetical protein
VDPCRLGLAADAIEQDGLSDPTQAHQHCALGMAADPGALERDMHLFEERIATSELDWGRAGARHKRVPDGVHGALCLLRDFAVYTKAVSCQTFA